MPSELLEQSGSQLDNDESQEIRPFLNDIRSQFVDFYTRHGIRTDEELHNFVKVVLNYNVPRTKICDKCCAPFDFVADNFFERVRNSLAFANRTGGKTRNFAILNFLDAWFKKSCEIAEVGAIKAQAYKCYRYTTEFFQLLPLARELVHALVSETLLTNGSTITVLAGTFTGVNSPHPQKANADEIELMPWNVLQEFFSMAKSRGRVMGQNRLASTRKFQYGTMQSLMEKIALGELDFKIYRWCIWEVIERCEQPPEACKDCALFSIRGSKGDELGCQGVKCRKADGFYSREDFIDKVKTLDIETLESQWFNLRPGAEGLVYKSFDPEVHAVSGLEHNPRWPTFCVYDFGYTNPFVCMWFQVDPSDNIWWLREYYVPGRTMSEHKKLLYEIEKKLGWHQIIKARWADISGAGERAELAQGKPSFITLPSEGEIADRISLVRQFLKVQDNGRPRMFFSKENCPNAIREHLRLHYPDQPKNSPISETPVKCDDHTTDAVQYGLWGWYHRWRSGQTDGKQLFGRARESVGAGGFDY